MWEAKYCITCGEFLMIGLTILGILRQYEFGFIAIAMYYSGPKKYWHT